MAIAPPVLLQRAVSRMSRGPGQKIRIISTTYCTRDHIFSVSSETTFAVRPASSLHLLSANTVSSTLSHRGFQQSSLDQAPIAFAIGAACATGFEATLTSHDRQTRRIRWMSAESEGVERPFAFAVVPNFRDRLCADVSARPIISHHPLCICNKASVPVGDIVCRLGCAFLCASPFSSSILAVRAEARAPSRIL